jgi:hypothetical protein
MSKKKLQKDKLHMANAVVKEIYMQFLYLHILVFPSKKYRKQKGKNRITQKIENVQISK